MPTKFEIVEDEIGRHLKKSQATGELTQAASYGKPLDFGAGYDEAPDDLRMGFKILKDAGFVPPEIEMMKQIATVRESLATLGDSTERAVLQRRLMDLELSLALAKDRL